MSTKLDRLIESIHPDNTLKETFARVNEAVNSFPFPNVLLEHFGQFRHTMISFHGHLEARILNIDALPQAGVDFLWSRCYGVFKQIYGVAAEKAAFEIARTNKEGGLREVIRKFSETVARNYAANEITARIYFYLKTLSVQERIAAAEEYVQKYGHLLPDELTESSAARIHDNFAKVLEKHVYMMYDLEKAAIQKI